MINLRYHIVSLTAVFLAIGIGLTLGSTFLDRATVENLNGQLESLEGRLQDREEQINSLEAELEAAALLSTSLDEQATGLLAGRLEGVPVVVLAARGVEESDLQGAVQTLVVSGADVQGMWWLTDRFALDDEGEVNDLALLLDETSTDPSRLRRILITRLGSLLRADQLTGDQPAPDDAAGDQPDTEESADGSANEVDPGTAPDGADVDADSTVGLLTALVEAGFVEFEAVPGGPESPTYAPGTRLLVAGGSTSVPDDLVLVPLVERMVRVSPEPVSMVVGSARSGRGDISDAVAVIRQDDELRELVPTVDSLEHFHGWAAMVLALEDIGVGTVGHYGLDESATRLLPPLRGTP